MTEWNLVRSEIEQREQREPQRRGEGNKARPTAAGTVALRERRGPAPKAKSSPAADIEAQLAAEFQRGGLSPEAARLAASRGRARPAPQSLYEAALADGKSPAAARAYARGRGGLREAVTDGSGFKATDYAYAPDLEDPASWKLLLVKQPGDGDLGAYDDDLVRAAANALATPEWGAPQVEIPAADLDRVKQTVRGAWIQAGLPVAEIPPALDEAALAAEFLRRGLSPEKAAIAARGREGRR